MPTPEEQIDNIVLRTLNDVGVEMVDDIRIEIGDLWPPSSDPLTPPHLRTGELQRSINYTIVQAGPLYILSIAADTEYAGYLENGTDRMIARPFMGPALARWEPLTVDRLQATFDYGAGGGSIVSPRP